MLLPKLIQVKSGKKWIEFKIAKIENHEEKLKAK